MKRIGYFLSLATISVIFVELCLASMYLFPIKLSYHKVKEEKIST